MFWKKRKVHDFGRFYKQILQLKIKLKRGEKTLDFYSLRELFISIDGLMFHIFTALGVSAESVSAQLKTALDKGILSRQAYAVLDKFHQVRNKVAYQDYVPDKAEIDLGFKALDALAGLVQPRMGKGLVKGE